MWFSCLWFACWLPALWSITEYCVEYIGTVDIFHRFLLYPSYCSNCHQMEKKRKKYMPFLFMVIFVGGWQVNLFMRLFLSTVSCRYTYSWTWRWHLDIPHWTGEFEHALSQLLRRCWVSSSTVLRLLWLWNSHLALCRMI